MPGGETALLWLALVCLGSNCLAGKVLSAMRGSILPRAILLRGPVMAGYGREETCAE